MMKGDWRPAGRCRMAQVMDGTMHWPGLTSATRFLATYLASGTDKETRKRGSGRINGKKGRSDGPRLWCTFPPTEGTIRAFLVDTWLQC